MQASVETASAPAIVFAPPAPLTLAALGQIAAGARVALGAGVRERLEASHHQLLELARAGRVVYGLNTGCGPLCDRAVPPGATARFQQNLVRSHASGLGPAHPPPVVRATMAVRAFSLAQGRSAVRPLLVDTLVAMLNAGIHPLVPETGSVGASGDLVELAHVASGLMGEGEVEWRGTRRPAAEALAAAARVHAARAHPGQQASAARLRALLDGSRHLRDGAIRPEAGNGRLAPVQDAYTLRCVPQVLGAVRDTVAHVRQVIEVEVNGVTDNPTFFPEEDVVLHAGNFHGQPVALAVDHLKVALAEVALFSERRLARLLDPATNGGLPPFLIRDQVGVRSGLMGLQYCASSTVADNAVLAHPASLGSVPTNANNQDVVGMGTVAVRHARRLLDNARRVVAIELLAAVEAVDLVGADGLGAGTRGVHARVRRLVAPLVEDRPLGGDVERLAGALDQFAG